MSVAGIDLSTHAIDIVLLDETTDAATWHRVELAGHDAFERARSVRAAMFRGFVPSRWDDVLAIGIEQPRGRNALVALGRVQGAVLACIPRDKLVQPWNPSEWRKTVGLPGNATKFQVAEWALDRWEDYPFGVPFDGTDAYCIALATRNLLQIKDAA